MQNAKKDEVYMNLVYLIASLSKDKRTHLGAVVIGPDGEIRSTGYNGFVRGANDNVPERQEKPEKFYWMEHAERNSIYNATLNGVSLKGCIMYTNGVPCADCARAIIQSGIKEIVVDRAWNDNNTERWIEHAKRSLVMFSEVGVKVRYYEAKKKEIVRFRGGEIREIKNLVEKKGLFIVFEGIDGCGKSTQVWKLGKYLAEINKYSHTVMTREPWQNPNIRKLLRETDDPYADAMKLTELYINDRKRHVNDLIIPRLAGGLHVISDRYSFSTFAYQQTQGIKLQKLIEMHRGLLIPDIIFIVDVDPKIAVKRMKNDRKRSTEQKFEKNLEFMQKLRKNFLNLPKQLENHNVVIIDGSKSAEDIFEKQVKPAFDKLYNSKFAC